MGKETKIGLVVVAVVAVFFGAFVVQRARRPEPEPAVAENTTQQGELGEPGSDLLEAPPVVVETGGFSTDLSAGDESNMEAMLDEPIEPGPVGDEAYDAQQYNVQPYDNQFTNAQNHEYNNIGPENETVEDLPHWQTRSNATQVEPLDEVPENDPGTSALAGPAFAPEAPLDDLANTENASSAPSGPTETHTQTQTRTSSGSSSTLVVDDARSSARFEETAEEAPNLFEGVDEEFAPPTPAPLADAVEPQSSFPARSPATEQWVVQEGDSFWSISRQVYGSGRYFKALARWNQNTVPDPARMRSGTVLETPPVALLEQVEPELVSHRETSSTASLPGLEGLTMPEQAGAFAGPLGRKYYLVGRTDTLFGISKKTLGQGSRWKELFDLNGDILEDPDRLSPGMILRLPSSAAVEVFLSSRPESGVIR